MKAIRPRIALLAGCAALMAAVTGYAFRPDPPRTAPGERGSNLLERMPDSVVADTQLEAKLAQIFDDIEQNRHDQALGRIEELIKAYPKFRLAHLIKGDLLLARSQPLTDFGQGGDKRAPDRVADLRDEAVARLRAYRSKPPADAVPRPLLQLAPDQKHALLVDTQKSRLYLYENQDGTPRFVADYYITQGKLGAEKQKEGDKKTPLGVYYVTADLPRNKLPDLYGSGAFPLNYPNEWDKRQGREGHGIWLHGTPSDTYSRPPKASDGCVVLTNPDLERIARKLQIGVTPVIISNSVEWLSPGDWQDQRGELQQVFDTWRKDWESRDVRRYATHYSKRFSAAKQDYASWIEQKERVAAGKEWIRIGADNVSMLRNPGHDDYVVVNFDQRYESNNLNNQMKKRQYWIREDSRWKIIYEGAA